MMTCANGDKDSAAEMKSSCSGAFDELVWKPCLPMNMMFPLKIVPVAIKIDRMQETESSKYPHHASISQDRLWRWKRRRLNWN